MPSHTRGHVACPGCHAHITPRRPSLLDRALLPLGWLFLALMIGFAGLLGPFLVMLAPALIVVGGSIASAVQERAFREPHCPRCGKILLDLPALAGALTDATAPEARARPRAASVELV